MKLKKKKKKRKAKLKNLHQIPGKVTYVGNKKDRHTIMEMICYNPENVKVLKSDHFTEILSQWNKEQITWLNVMGLSETDQIETIGKHFGIHNLVLEDMVNTRQRPKVDEYDNYIFMVLKMVWLDKEEYISEHISLILGENYVLSFQEAENDVFEKLRDRIINSLGIIRTRGAEFLMYSILDIIVDHYFVVIDDVGNRLEKLENSIFRGTADDVIVQNLQILKPEIFQLKKVVAPMRDIASQLKNSEHKLLHQKSYNYLRDLHDNCVQILENVEMYREMAMSVTDMYISTLNNKMNEVMKVLTIMASIFIPLTFIAGVYGMNFVNMPELEWENGYYYVLILMLFIIIIMLIYFKRKKWL